MRSMTGFGVGSAPLDSGSMTLEVRSLNHRYLEIRVRLPPEISEHAFFLEQQCRQRLSRGRFDVSVRIEGAAGRHAHVNQEVCLGIFDELSILRDRVAPGTEVPLSLLGAFPGALGATTCFDPEGARHALLRSLDAALGELDAMRAAEGANLAAELKARLQRALDHLAQLQALVPRLSEAYEARLRQRVAKFAGEVADVDQGRLITELAIVAERSDITEEIVRFESHCGQFAGMICGQEPCGRKLDFLLQEMSREVNTIGAKCHDARASAIVVGLKAELEKLREQVQNVE